MTGEPCNGGLLPRALDVLFNSVGEFQTKPCVGITKGNICRLCSTLKIILACWLGLVFVTGGYPGTNHTY